MKKKLLLLFSHFLAGYLFYGSAVAQTPAETFGNQIHFQYYSKDKNVDAVMPGTFSAADTAVYQVFDFINKTEKHEISVNKVPLTPILLGVKLSPELLNFFPNSVKSISKSFNSYIISDGSPAIVIALGITKENVKDYRYRVVENDSIERVPWSEIPALEQNYGAKQAYGFIGKFQSPGKQLLIEIINIHKYSIRDGVIFDWRVKFKPTVTQMLVTTLESVKDRQNFFNIRHLEHSKGFVSKFDPQTGLPQDLKFNQDSITNLRLYFGRHESISYSIYLLRKLKTGIDTVRLGAAFKEGDIDIGNEHYKEPGHYEIVIQRLGILGQWQEDQISRIPFEVKPPPLSGKTVSLKQLIPYSIATLSSVALFFFVYHKRTRSKLKSAAREKQIAGLKLRSIRAQLNPHFMFNALTSIQNLINKDNIADANSYLVRFARLTRQILDASNEEFLSLEEEILLIDDYLCMEQLRFNFEYSILIDNELELANIEIPAMLLQPLVENAVKHGVSGLKKLGKISVIGKVEGTDLLFSIIDNGKGFDKDKEITGYGQKLCEERVSLLNTIYKEQSVALTIETNQQGTSVSVRLLNWIA